MEERFTNSNTNFSNELKTKRTACGITQSQLADMLNLSRQNLNRIENGKANASDEMKNILTRCLDYHLSERPLFLLVDYLSVRFSDTDAPHIIRELLQMKQEYFFHYDFASYGYKEKYTYGEITVMASPNASMGAFLELKGTGCRQLERVLQAQNRSWYDFLKDCIGCGGVIKRFDLAVNDCTGILDIPVLSERYCMGNVIFRSHKFETVNSGKLSGKDSETGKTLYIGSKSSPLYFCLYEKDKEQSNRGKQTDIKNRFEIRLRNKQAVGVVEELLLTHNPLQLVFSLINRYVYFPDYPLWEIFISCDDLPLEMRPMPVNVDNTLKWLERQVAPTLKVIREIGENIGVDYLGEIENQTHLNEKHKMKIKQMTTDIQEIILNEGVFDEQ